MSKAIDQKLRFEKYAHEKGMCLDSRFFTKEEADRYVDKDTRLAYEIWCEALALLKEPCEWKRTQGFTEDFVWETACGQAHTFFEGGPNENSHKFCPFCGQPIKEIK